MKITKELGESDNNCVMCKGTGYLREICFGYPGYYDKLCYCVKKPKIDSSVIRGKQ